MPKITAGITMDKYVHTLLGQLSSGQDWMSWNPAEDLPAHKRESLGTLAEDAARKLLKEGEADLAYPVDCQSCDQANFLSPP